MSDYKKTTEFMSASILNLLWYIILVAAHEKNLLIHVYLEKWGCFKIWKKHLSSH